MTSPALVKELLIKGVTRDGNRFRPGDWADLPCGVMAAFRPDASTQGGQIARAYLGYSAYVRPALIAGVRSVIVDARLRELEPRAWDFVVGFARDNDLVTLGDDDLVAALTLPAIAPAAG